MSHPSISSAVARQVKEKNALIGNLNLKITSLEAELKEAAFQLRVQTGVADNLRRENATLMERLQAVAPSAKCCVSGKWWSVAELEENGWWDDHYDQWYGPDELDSRPDWTEDMEDDWEECYGHSKEGAIHTYEMCGGCPEWWKYKVISVGANNYLVFIENKNGWEIKKDHKLFMRGDYMLLEAPDECHSSDYLDTEDWEWRESMDIADILDW